MSIDSVMPSSHLILYRPLLLLPPIPRSIRVFSSESALCIRWPKYWSFSFNNSLSNKYSRLISFRINWFDLLAVQGTLQQSPPAPQFESINSLVFSLLYGQLSHLYIATPNCSQEKAMATPSSTLAWKIPWTEEPGRLQSMGSRRVRHD